MVRHGRAAALDEPAPGSERLAAMGLQRSSRGWVPEWEQPQELLPAAEPEAGVCPMPGPSIRTPEPTVGSLVRGWLEDRLPPWAPAVLDRVRLGSVITGVVMLAAVGLAGVMLFHHHAAGGYSSAYDASATGSAYPSDPVVSVAPTSVPDAASIVVDVGGRVRKPGLVTLPAGARVADAIAAAGGPLRHKEIATLDLAARVSDGQLLLIGLNPAAAADGGGDSAGGSPAPVSLSSATIDELETLPGVGPVTAQKIIDWRSAHNGFPTVAALQQVPGIGPAKYAELSPLVTP